MGELGSFFTLSMPVRLFALIGLNCMFGQLFLIGSNGNELTKGNTGLTSIDRPISTMI